MIKAIPRRIRIDHSRLEEFMTKYQYNETVYFICDNKVFEGTIAIIDAHGTFERPGETSYDIMSTLNGQDCLFKHFPEHCVYKTREEAEDKLNNHYISTLVGCTSCKHYQEWNDMGMIHSLCGVIDVPANSYGNMLPEPYWELASKISKACPLKRRK